MKNNNSYPTIEHFKKDVQTYDENMKSRLKVREHQGTILGVGRGATVHMMYPTIYVRRQGFTKYFDKAIDVKSIQQGDTAIYRVFKHAGIKREDRIFIIKVIPAEEKK